MFFGLLTFLGKEIGRGSEGREDSTSIRMKNERPSRSIVHCVQKREAARYIKNTKNGKTPLPWRKPNQFEAKHRFVWFCLIKLGLDLANPTKSGNQDWVLGLGLGALGLELIL